MSTTEISTENYGILKNFPEFYKQVFTCFNLSKDLNQNNVRSLNTESFYCNQFGQILSSFLKAKRFALMNKLKVKYCMLKTFLKKTEA